MEALYARGFTQCADSAALSSADFQYALSWERRVPVRRGDLCARPVPPADPAARRRRQFNPVEPGRQPGRLRPARAALSTGPVEYLHELLEVSRHSTCDDPLQPGRPERLASLLTHRRGPLGELLATAANLETPLPVIDLVNESLETLARTPRAEARCTTLQRTRSAVTWLADRRQARRRRRGATTRRRCSPRCPNTRPGHAGRRARRLRDAAATTSRARPAVLAAARRRTAGTWRRCARAGSPRCGYFRRDITEFAIDAAARARGVPAPPVALPGPVGRSRSSTCGISPEEYAQLYDDDAARRREHGQPAAAHSSTASQPAGRRRPGRRSSPGCPSSCAARGLTYCELVDLRARRVRRRSRPAAPAAGTRTPTAAGLPGLRAVLPRRSRDRLRHADPQGTLDDTRPAPARGLHPAVATLPSSPYAALTMSELADVGVVLGLFDGTAM